MLVILSAAKNLRILPLSLLLLVLLLLYTCSESALMTKQEICERANEDDYR